MTLPAPDRVYRPNPDTVFKEEGDGGFLFHPETGQLAWLNHTAALSWSLLNGKTGESAIIQKLAEEYPRIEQTALAGDVDRFFTLLQQGGFIFPEEAPSPPDKAGADG